MDRKRNNLEQSRIIFRSIYLESISQLNKPLQWKASSAIHRKTIEKPDSDTLINFSASESVFCCYRFFRLPLPRLLPGDFSISDLRRMPIKVTNSSLVILLYLIPNCFRNMATWASSADPSKWLARSKVFFTTSAQVISAVVLSCIWASRMEDKKGSVYFVSHPMIWHSFLMIESETGDSIR